MADIVGTIDTRCKGVGQQRQTGALLYVAYARIRTSIARVISRMSGNSNGETPDNESARAAEYEGPYFLLKDEPIEHGDEDFLGASGVAAGIASMLESSIKSSPFVLAVDAGWGMGKSSLLHQIEDHLSKRPEIVKLHFNAWTSGGSDALEGLIKAVLAKLDRNSLRRGMRWLARQRNLLIVAQIMTGFAASFLVCRGLSTDSGHK